jgi:aldehyde dehydrogenase (NAD+)
LNKVAKHEYASMSTPVDRYFPDNIAKNYVGGKWMGGDDGKHIAVYDPADGTKIASCALADNTSLHIAIDAARLSFERGDIADMRPIERASLMRKIATEIRKLADDGAHILCRESGKTLNDAKDEFEEAAQYFEYYGGVADKIEGKSIPLGQDYVDYTIYEPHGVSAQIVPWNFPVSLAARSLAPAIAAGNSVIIKSPELDPLALSLLGHAFDQAGVPHGVLSILNGIGSKLGAQLVASNQIDQIVFTGSVPTGQSILRAASENITPTLMELGGKSAAIAFQDANINTLLDSIRYGIFFNAGQVCSAMSRLLVHEDIYQDVIDQSVHLAENLTIGHGLDNPDHTPLISAQQLDNVEKLTSMARQDRAMIATGGSRLDRPGHFMAPTILTHVDPSSHIAQNEIFGPVLCISKFKTQDEAIQIANSTEFGLVAGVFTSDITRAHQSARKLRAGQIFVNEWFAGGIATPFGGVGKSGFGREKGLEALYNYVHTKNIAISLKSS